MGGAATSRWVGGDGRCCYLKVGGRGWEGMGGDATSRWEGGDGKGWEGMLPQGEWEGMGGDAASRWVGGDGRCCYLKVGGRGWEGMLPQGGWEGMGGDATSRRVGGDGRCCYLKVGGRGWEVLLPQGGWEGMGGAATSRWEGMGRDGCGRDSPLLALLAPRAQRESVDLAIQLLNDSDYRGYRIYVELVSHQLQRGHVHLQRQSPAAACLVYYQPLRQEQTVADVYFVCYDQRAGPLDQMGPLVTVDAHCCINYYTYIQYTLLYIHTVYITMHTYSIHTVCMFLYVQACTVCMQQIYKYSGQCRVYTYKVCVLSVTHVYCVCVLSITHLYCVCVLSVTHLYCVCVEHHTRV